MGIVNSNWRGGTLRKITVIIILSSFMLLFLVGSVHADIYMRLNVYDDATARLNIKITDMEPEIYDEISSNKTAITTAVANAINASSVDIVSNDTARSIEIICSLTDEKIDQEVDTDKMLQIIRVKTEWMKFSLPLTQNVSIDFAQLLSPRVSAWNKTDNGYIYTSTSDFGKVTFEIVGPSSTTSFYVDVDGETVIFELPPSKSDLFINSPYIMLVIVIVLILIAIVYRKLRYG